MPDPTVTHRVSQGQAHVFLPQHLLEALRAETTVQRLVGDGSVAGVGRARRGPRALGLVGAGAPGSPS